MSSNDQQYQQQPTINKTSEMNDLPNELLPLIFKHLRIKDLVRCRMVCKRFLFFCDEVKLEELVITYKVKNKKAYWFHTMEKFNHADGIDINTFIMCRSKFRFDQLKRLYFKGSYEDYKLLNLNDSTQLEQLRIHSIDTIRHDVDRVVNINLPNLKVLHEDSCSDYYNLQLNTPKLEFLKSESFDFMTIHHPDSIKHLERDRCLCRLVNSFKNVEYLKFDLALLPRVHNFISAYPKLKTLLCNYDFHEDDEDEDYGEVSGEEFNIESMNALRQLVKQRPDLTIYYQSVKLDNVQKIDEYDPLQHLAFQINNYDSLCDDIFDNDMIVDYNELMRLVNGTLPDDFYKKYFNIQSLRVTENVESEEHFVEFLKRLEYLNDLSLEKVSFNQGFYDRLPEMDQLSLLYLGKSVKPSNYDWLFKMNRLKTLYTHQNPIEFFDLALALFRGLKHFRSITFDFDKENFEISANTSRNKYSVHRQKENAKNIFFEKNGMNFDELVGLLTTYKNYGLKSNPSD